MRFALTDHAVGRYRQRVRMGATEFSIRASANRGVPLTARHVEARWSRLTKTSKRTYMATATALFVVARGDTVVTVVAVTEDDLAAILVWHMMGVFLAPEQDEVVTAARNDGSMRARR